MLCLLISCGNGVKGRRINNLFFLKINKGNVNQIDGSIIIWKWKMRL